VTVKKNWRKKLPSPNLNTIENDDDHHHNYKRLDRHPFNSPISGITQVSQYQKGKTNLDFKEARDSE